MAHGKRTVWISLEGDLAAALKDRGEPLSHLVNDVVRSELSRQPAGPTPAPTTVER